MSPISPKDFFEGHGVIHPANKAAVVSLVTEEGIDASSVLLEGITNATYREKTGGLDASNRAIWVEREWPSPEFGQRVIDAIQTPLTA